MKTITLLSTFFNVIMIFSNTVIAREYYSSYADKSYPKNVYWGDTHLHTKLSGDANAQGNLNLEPDDAYRFARGESITAHNGMKARLSRPLDFLVVADHAIGLGVMNSLRIDDSVLLETEKGKNLYREMTSILQNNGDNSTAIKDFSYKVFGNENYLINDNQYRISIWQSITESAEKFNHPGTFTAFIGYEWTSSFDQGTRHRVVIFKDGADKANQILPFSAQDSNDPEDLWEFLQQYEEDTKGEVLAIAHNPNLSNGGEFSIRNQESQKMGETHAKMRSRWEPLLEVTQIKGDSESHPLLSPTDEFSDYETWEEWSVIGAKTDVKKKVRRKEEQERLKYEYARSGLKLGLKLQADMGVNPFKFGMIGSTDAHTSMAAAAENNFWGKHTIVEPFAGRISHPRYRWRMNAAGYAAVWAEQNTRESLFTAMKRKEVYASTGPRMTVRFFGGWGYKLDDAVSPDLALMGYTKGVPMGGDLTAAPKNKSPNFLIRAVKDPDGANLDRVQVIKGWHDTNGELHEKIYNVALSDNRKANERGNVKPVGNTVDIPDASYTNTIGDPELAVVWQDPDFDKDELAFYYVRVLEIPTPRWTAYDAKFFGLKDVSEDIPMITQERAYTSPIWYSPK